MREKIVFSTRNIGPDYIFTKKAVGSTSSKVTDFQFDFLFGDRLQQIQDMLGINDEDLKKRLLNNIVGSTNGRLEKNWKLLLRVSKYKKVFLDLMSEKKEKLDVLWRNKGVEERIIDTLDRFNYYTTEDGQDTSLCAVHCLPGASGSIEWVGALIEDAVSENLGTDEEKTLYLLLHDKDVPGYEEQTFRVLNSNEVKEILKAYLEVSSKEEDLEKVELGGKGCKEKEGEWFYEEWKIKILVFNHVSNAAVALTRKKGCTANEIVSQVKEIFENKMGEFFDGASDNLQAKKSRFGGLSLDGYVDLCDREVKDDLFEEKMLSDNRKYYVYKDNGALVTELMHVRTDVKAAIQFKRFVGIAHNQNKFPIIIRVYKSFFDDWAAAVDDEQQKKDICKHHNKIAMEENLERAFTFFNNSSIWVRLVDINDENAYDTAVAEFEYFDKIGLYDYASAWENLEYNLRIFAHYYLESSLDGHGSFVTPVLYGNETESRKILLENYIETVTQNNNNDITCQTDDTRSTEENKKELVIQNINSLWDALKNATNEYFNILKNRISSKDQDNKQVSNQERGSKKDIIDLSLVNKNNIYKFFKEFHNVALRILVVDDKVGGVENKEELTEDERKKTFCNYRKNGTYYKLEKKSSLKIYKCEDCGEAKQCKLRTLLQLIDDGNSNGKKAAIFEGIGKTKDYFYWQGKGIETYFCPDIINDFIDDKSIIDGVSELRILDGLEKTQDTNNSKDYILDVRVVKGMKYDEDNNIKARPAFVEFEGNDNQDVAATSKNELKVQLVGVRDVRTALLLLSRYKFDMIFFDYLLDKKDTESSERDYSIQFFDFLTGKKDAPALEKLRRDVLDNRGPLDKFWIMPITGFNETFIADLSRNGIPLISSKWHINNGADPITTPWQFLDKLNRFIELQLTGSVFTLNKLLMFLQYTGADLKEKFWDGNRFGEIGFEEFQAFLAAEYSSFFNHYGSKAVIKRDAATDGSDRPSKSVFATNVWRKFYRSEGKNKKEEDKLLFGLHSHMMEFYQIATIMHNDHHGVLMLRESFRRLRYFIDVNRLVDEPRAGFEENEKANFYAMIDVIADCIDLVERMKNVKNSR